VTALNLIVDSANAAAVTVGTDSFAKLTKHALNLTGAAVAKHVVEDDIPGLFSPCEVEQGGKGRMGSILALERRAVIAWTVGTLRIKNFEATVDYNAIRHIEMTERSGGSFSHGQVVLTVTTDDNQWVIRFAPVFDGGVSIVPLIQCVLEGSMKFVSE